MTETQLKSEALARFVVETPVEAVPDAMMKKAVRHILDSVGAGVAGAISTEALPTPFAKKAKARVPPRSGVRAAR